MIRRICLCALCCALSWMASAVTVSFVNLPFAEGTLFVAVYDGDKMIEGKAVAVESDGIDVTFDLSAYEGKKFDLKAFQDLNGNGDIDFNDAGIPTEPFLLESITVKGENQALTFQLTQY